MHFNRLFTGCRATTALALFFVALTPSVAPAAGAFAEVHPRMRRMQVVRAELNEQANDGSKLASFDQPIPRIIHQVWGGSPATFDFERTASWQQVAAKHGYDYHLWTEDDDAYVTQLFGPEVMDYVYEMRRLNRWAVASDIIRYHLIEHFGGSYFDVDVTPPMLDGSFVDPAQVWPMRGLVLFTEKHVREVDNSAFYVHNSIFCASPKHPVMTALKTSLLPNRVAQRDLLDSYLDGPVHITGQSLFTATVRGPFTLVPGLYHHDLLNMQIWCDTSTYIPAKREAFARRVDAPKRIVSIHPANFDFPVPAEK